MPCVMGIQPNGHGSMTPAASAACSWPRHGEVDGGHSLCWLRTPLLCMMEPAGPRDAPGSACTPWYLLLHCSLCVGRFKPPHNTFSDRTSVTPAEVSLWAVQRSCSMPKARWHDLGDQYSQKGGNTVVLWVPPLRTFCRVTLRVSWWLPARALPHLQACSQAPRKVLGLGLDVHGNGGIFLLLLEVMVSLSVFKNSVLVSWSANPRPFLGHAAFH